MSEANAPAGAPSAWSLIQDVVRRFDEAWRLGDPPAIEEVLHTAGPVAGRSELLADLVRVEFEWRLRRGQPARVEEYAARYPSLTGQPLEEWELIKIEFAARRRKEALTLEDYAGRFPGQRERLRRLFAGRGGAPTPEVPGYDIVAPLGSGGMGAVFKARDRALDRHVALKVIAPRGRSAAEADGLLAHEVRAVARLQHPNVVQVFEVGECENGPFFTMELVEGGSLADRLLDGPLPAAAAARLVEQLARAVHYAHAQGVIHRDLKPANILLARKELAPAPGEGTAADQTVEFDAWQVTPKVGDFGLAKCLGPDESQGETYAVRGTPGFMAPEQTGEGAKAVGPCVDVYGLGALLYACLTGRPPFQGATPLETMRLVQECEPVPVRELRPEVPRDLETVCAKCLAKAAERRYATAAELADDLGRFLAGEPVRARPVPVWERAWRWARRRPAAAAAVGVMALACTAVVGVTWASNAELRQKNGELEQARDQEAAQRQAAEEQRGRAEHLAELYRLLAAAYQAKASPAALTAPAAFRSLRRPALTAAECEQAGVILETLLRERPGDDELRGDLAVSRLNLGALLFHQNRPREARAKYEAALGVLRPLAAARPTAPRFRRELATALYNLARLEEREDHADAAFADYREAAALAEQLAAEQPADATARDLSALAQFTRGDYLGARGQAAEAERCFLRALADWERLARDHPETADYTVRAALVNGALGKLALHSRNDLPAAVKWLDLAIGRFEDVLRAQPQNEECRQGLGIAHAVRGDARGRQKKYTESLADWERAVELANPDERDLRRLFRAGMRAHLGDHAPAAAEVAELARRPVLDGGRRSHMLACVYGLCVAAARADTKLPAAERDRLAQGYTRAAVALLQAARRADLYGSPEGRKYLDGSDELEPLRGDPGYRQFLHEVSGEH